MSRYFENSDHFSNYIAKAIRNEIKKLNTDKIIDEDTIIEIYNKNHSDAFAWEMRQDITILEEDNFRCWMKIRESDKRNKLKKTQKLYNLTNDFVGFIESLQGVPGVYVFTTQNNREIYIGVSKNLRERIVSSYKERDLSNIDKKIYVHVYKTETIVDAHIIEPYLISNLNPILNTHFKGKSTIKIHGLPQATERVLCKDE